MKNNKTTKQAPGEKPGAEEKSESKPTPARANLSNEKSSLPLLLRWFVSKTVREARAVRSHVHKLVNHQRDILSPPALAAIEGPMTELDRALADGAGNADIEDRVQKLAEAADKSLKPYPSATWRENVEVILVALAVAMGIRTFFLQPFKIPTGSMQPTLYSVISENLLNRPDYKIPTGWERVKEWFAGVSYVHVVAKNDGTLDKVEEPFKVLIFNIWQRLEIGGVTHWIWFPPDYGSPQITNPSTGTLGTAYRANLSLGRSYKQGQDVVNLKVVAGDHLFVDRLSYNFRQPDRGEIVVFSTHGIEGITDQDTFYIKRLVGLSGETLTLHEDHRTLNVPGWGAPLVGNLVVDGKPITAATPHFQNLYSFNGAAVSTFDVPYVADRYFGHALLWRLEPGRSWNVATNHLFVMGDNTMNSSDSRYWGDFDESKVIGQSFFVYWPITDRFGWGYHR